MEDQNSLFRAITTDRRLGLCQTRTEQKLFQRSRRVDIDSARDMSTIIFIVETAVDNMERHNLVVVFTVQ